MKISPRMSRILANWNWVIKWYTVHQINENRESHGWWYPCDISVTMFSVLLPFLPSLFSLLLPVIHCVCFSLPYTFSLTFSKTTLTLWKTHTYTGGNRDCWFLWLWSPARSDDGHLSTPLAGVGGWLVCCKGYWCGRLVGCGSCGCGNMI